MKDYKLFVGTICPYCKKVENFMSENNIDIKIVNIEKGGKRQVPCLYHDGEYLYESDDIIKFLGQN